jgi:pSer/pThr/pTyr-binding forkhead associated (FHA) protein
VKTFFLRVRLEGSETWQETEIKNTIIVGRGDTCGFVIADRLASRQHAQISIKNDEAYLVDLHSSNGTKILGQRILSDVPRKLAEGDYFSIGHALCQVVSNKTDNPYRLWYRIEDQAWQEVTFLEELIIGRGDDVGLKVQEGHISRNHAVIKVSGGNFYLQDLGSQNGTYLEGQQLAANQPVQIYPGQYFKIGRATFTVVNVEKQVAFHQTVADLSTGAQAARSAAPVYPSPQISPTNRSKKTVWPWLLGIGGMLMLCVCSVSVGGLYLLDRAAGAALEEMDQVSEIVGDYQEDITDLVDEGINAAEDTDSIIPGEIGETISENEDLVDTAAGIVNEGEEDNSVTSVDGSGLERKWLIMLYQNADDEILEYDITFDVNTAEYVGSTDEVAVVAQLDRYNGSYDGDGDWTGARRYYLTQDGNLEAITSTVSADLGEVDSGDVNTLVDFAMWAVQTYPAENYVLIMSDHGAGWFGGYMDSDNGNEDGIYLPALESALQYITAQSGIGKFDILGFDACLMAELEVWAAVAPYASIGVASEESESATGWAYAAFLSQLVSNPDMDAEGLSRAIVNTFVVEDMAFDLYGWNPADVMADSTLSAIQLDQIPAINTSVDGLAAAMQAVDQSLIAEARTYTRSYLAFDGYEPFYLDLVHFSQMTCNVTNDSGICSAAAIIEDTVNNAIIIEKHGSGMDGSNGVTFYFPDSDFFEITKDNSYGYAYRAHAYRFTEASVWDEFLDFHYQVIERMP